jgi:organic hydroperoxide reductase OsmC/OhrA
MARAAVAKAPLWQHQQRWFSRKHRMSEYTAQLVWQRGADEAFTDNRYNRKHELRFDGGAVVAGSSAPSSVPLPYSDASAVDPEEMFVASLSSCHALWFLALAAKAGYVVDHYTDGASGTLAKDARGKVSMTLVTLRPRVAFSGSKRPTETEHAALHHEAHEKCYIANSVLAEVRCEPTLA